MSTEIAKLEGTEGKLYLTQFYGGIKKGLSLQLTTVNHDSNSGGLDSRYVCFTKPQVQQLVKELQNWLGEAELPWKSNGQIAFENYVRNTILDVPLSYHSRTWKRLSVEQQQNWEEMFP